MGDESGELMELVEEVPLKELGDAKVEISAWLHLERYLKFSHWRIFV